ncbi:hypothetical protein [Nocardia abscessus]|uniref:hypothetical protein n=1 Tax=Nocardia abscessus TaxID=120957 RepID=UPI00245654C3|nr:hypothetical protein [Nocardia abscessus]
MFTPVRPKLRIGEINFYSCTPTTKDESFGRAIEGIADTLAQLLGTRTDSIDFAWVKSHPCCISLPKFVHVMQIMFVAKLPVQAV